MNKSFVEITFDKKEYQEQHLRVNRFINEWVETQNSFVCKHCGARKGFKLSFHHKCCRICGKSENE